VRRGVAVATGVGLLVLAFGVTLTEPGDDLSQQPFPVRGGVGQQLVASTFASTVTDVQLADRVDSDDWDGTTAGIWLVAAVTGEATVETVGLDAEVVVDGVEYDATARYGYQVTDELLNVGFPLVGFVLVELPADILDAPGADGAVLRITPTFDYRLDSITEVAIDLTALPRVDRVDVDRAREAAP
jgi:hypothetical protein